MSANLVEKNVFQERRKEGERRRNYRREGDVVNDDLRALIQAEMDARKDRDRLFEKTLDEVKAGQAEDRKALARVSARVVTAATILVGLFIFLQWIGPTRFANLMKAVFSGGTP